MINKLEAEALRSKFGCNSAFTVSSNGNSGGLCVYWRDDCDFRIVSFYDHHIAGHIWSNGVVLWQFVGFYGWADYAHKSNSWELIQNLCYDPNIPTLVRDDFNDVLHTSELEGYSDSTPRCIDEFREVLDDCELKDIGYDGQWFTWERGLTTATRKRSRLDRFVANAN